MKSWFLCFLRHGLEFLNTAKSASDLFVIKVHVLTGQWAKLLAPEKKFEKLRKISVCKKIANTIA